MNIIPKAQLLAIIKQLDRNLPTYSKDDDELNILLSLEYLMRINEEDVMRILQVSLKELLYSKYYWFTQLVNRHHEVYGPDAGFDQQQDQILDEIDQRIPGVMDWELIENIYNGRFTIED